MPLLQLPLPLPLLMLQFLLLLLLRSPLNCILQGCRKLHHPRLSRMQQGTGPLKKRHLLLQFLNFSAPKRSLIYSPVNSAACQKRPFQ
jgi:hypothetical protein